MKHIGKFSNYNEFEKGINTMKAPMVTKVGDNINYNTEIFINYFVIGSFYGISAINWVMQYDRYIEQNNNTYFIWKLMSTDGTNGQFVHIHENGYYGYLLTTSRFPNANYQFDTVYGLAENGDFLNENDVITLECNLTVSQIKFRAMTYNEVLTLMTDGFNNHNSICPYKKDSSEYYLWAFGAAARAFDDNTPHEVTVTIDDAIQILNPDQCYADQGYTELYSQNYCNWMDDETMYIIDPYTFPADGDVYWTYFHKESAPDAPTGESEHVTVYINNEPVILDRNLTFSDQGYDEIYDTDTYNSNTDVPPENRCYDYPADGIYYYTSYEDTSLNEEP